MDVFYRVDHNLNIHPYCAEIIDDNLIQYINTLGEVWEEPQVDNEFGILWFDTYDNAKTYVLSLINNMVDQLTAQKEFIAEREIWLNEKRMSLLKNVDVIN